MMIHKVSEQNTLLQAFSDIPEKTDMSMSGHSGSLPAMTSAADSFKHVLAVTANKMIANGTPIADVAAKFNMKEADLQEIAKQASQRDKDYTPNPRSFDEQLEDAKNHPLPPTKPWTMPKPKESKVGNCPHCSGSDTHPIDCGCSHPSENRLSEGGCDKCKHPKSIIRYCEDCKQTSPLNSKSRIACDCEQTVKTASAEPSELDKAEEAYNQLHGVKASKELPEIKINKSKMSAVAANITEQGGPKRRNDRNNSIWDPNVNERLSKTPDNGELIRQARSKEDKRRAEILAASRNDSVNIEELKKTLQGKDCAFYSASSPEAHKYSKKLPTNSMSIFDTKEFERLPETPKPAEPEVKKATKGSMLNKGLGSSKDIFKKMFDSMTKEVKE